MVKKPLFSVIIPAHNEEGVIGRALETVLSQSCGDFEIVVSNDGSTDLTESVVREYMKRDKRIRIISSRRGHSAAYARNKGSSIARGSILVFLDADTFINKDFLQSIKEKSSKADAFITLNYPFKKKLVSLILSSFLGPNVKERLVDGSCYTAKNHQVAGSMFFVISREYYKKIGGYSDKIFYFEDQDFVDKFYALGGKAVFVKGAVQYYELPSTMGEFFRQCKWLGKGINVIPDVSLRSKRRMYWFFKSLVVLSPLFFWWNGNLALIVFLCSFLFQFFSLVMRNHNFFLSLAAMPFLYLKNLLVSWNILRFMNKKL